MKTDHLTEEDWERASTVFFDTSENDSADLIAAVASLPEPPPAPAKLLPIVEPMPPVPQGCVRWFTYGDGCEFGERDKRARFYINIQRAEKTFEEEMLNNEHARALWALLPDEARQIAIAAWKNGKE